MSSTEPALNPASQPFTAAQKEYLAGFMAGIGASAPAAPPAPAAAEELFHGTPVSDLCREERWKHDENPLDSWDRLLRHADAGQLPDAENTYRFKTFGLFHVAPAQDSFMLRLRVPGCDITSAQFHGLADLAADLGGGCAHLTTRGNLQIREFKPADIVRVLTRVQDLGLTAKGSGVDNVRNVTASPDSGFAPDELIDVRPFAKALHHYILNHRDLYGLPRKFNVAFDSGGSMSVAADTNDIGFVAVRVMEKTGSSIAPGIYFRVQLGGITGHKDFAKDTGLLVRPSEAVALAAAMIRVFAAHGCRTDRRNARLKYLLADWGVEKFIAESARRLAFPLLRLPLEACEPRRPVEKHSWLGLRKQAQKGLNSLGVGVPVGRLSARQMHALADLATSYGRGELRLTVWQNLLIPHVPDAFAATLARSVQRLGFFTEASAAAGGVIACTGSRGCRYAAADTKAHAHALIRHLQGRVSIGAPVNIHFTGCAHSCAQHYCGDIGLIGAKLADGSEGYHVVLGGGMDHEQGIAREIFRGVRATEVEALVEKVLKTYEATKTRGETFVEWTRRHSVKELQEVLS